MAAYIQLKNILKEYFESHAQINTVVWGDNHKFASERNITYPVANIEYIESNVISNKMGFVFRFVLADKIDPSNEDMKDDVLDDMLKISQDFMGWAQQQRGFEFIKSSQIAPLHNEYGDRLSGVRFRVTLSTILKSSPCGTPIKNQSHD